MVTSDLVESYFAKMTSHIQSYSRINVCSSARVSNIARNGFISQCKNKKEIKKVVKGLFHTLPGQLRLIVLMVFIEDSTGTRDSNKTAISLQHQQMHEEEAILKQKGMEDASEKYIVALMFCQNWDADVVCKIITEARRCLRSLQCKNEKLHMLTHDIQMCVLGMRWTQFKTQRPKHGIHKWLKSWQNSWWVLLSPKEIYVSRRSHMFQFHAGQMMVYWVSLQIKQKNLI